MATLEYNDIKPKKYIIWNQEPYEVLDAHVFRKQQRKPVNATKLKNLITGKVIENSFHQSDKVTEAELDTKQAIYLYTNRGEYWFCDQADRSKRFQIPADILGEKIKFVKENSTLNLLLFDDRIIGVDIPIKVELTVSEAPPAVKGNTAQGGTKQIVLETGATINAPLFINPGDKVRINTETGQYAERV